MILEQKSIGLSIIGTRKLPKLIVTPIANKFIPTPRPPLEITEPL